MNTLEQIKKHMVEKNITSIHAEYCGSGDSGNIEKLSAYRGEISLPEREVNKIASLNLSLEDLVYDLIGENHPGYEINEGGYGDIDLILKNGQLRMKYTKTDWVPSSETLEKAV